VTKVQVNAGVSLWQALKKRWVYDQKDRDHRVRMWYIRSVMIYLITCEAEVLVGFL